MPPSSTLPEVTVNVSDPHTASVYLHTKIDATVFISDGAKNVNPR